MPIFKGFHYSLFLEMYTHVYTPPGGALQAGIILPAGLLTV